MRHQAPRYFNVTEKFSQPIKTCFYLLKAQRNRKEVLKRALKIK